MIWGSYKYTIDSFRFLFQHDAKVSVAFRIRIGLPTFLEQIAIDIGDGDDVLGSAAKNILPRAARGPNGYQV
jgi:hypothetical protein